jgi:hypothetical protein
VNWIVAPQGPIFMCSTNSTVIFQWQSTTEHSVFQIPNDACPPSFDAGATDDFKFLASPSKASPPPAAAAASPPRCAAGSPCCVPSPLSPCLLPF